MCSVTCSTWRSSFSFWVILRIQFFSRCFIFCFFSADIFWYLLLAYSLFLSFSSSDNPLYQSRAIFCNLSLFSLKYHLPFPINFLLVIVV